MENTERVEELTEEVKDNVVPFKLLTGGKGSSGFWLLDLEIGTVFLARPKTDQRGFVLGEFVVYNIVEMESLTAYLLLVNEGGDRPRPCWVDPKRFSNQMDLIGVVRTRVFTEVGSASKEEKEIEHDESLRPILAGGLQDDATPEAER